MAVTGWFALSLRVTLSASLVAAFAASIGRGASSSGQTLPVTRDRAAVQELPAWVSALDYRVEEIRPIQIGAYGYPFVRLEVNGVELELPFDTGNMVGLSLSSEWIERLSLPRIDEWRSRASDGALRGTYGVHEADRVVAFGVEMKGERVYELAHTDVPGLLGPQLLHDKRFTVDYRNRIMAITERPLAEWEKHTGWLDLVPSSRRRDLLLVCGEVGGRRVLMQIDTGKSRSTIDPELAATLDLERTETGAAVDELRFGGHEFSVPSAKLVVLRQIDPGLPEPILFGIGSDILRQVMLTVDRIGGRLLVQGHPRL